MELLRKPQKGTNAQNENGTFKSVFVIFVPFVAKEPVSLNNTVRDCARAAEVLAIRKGVRLNLETRSVSSIVSTA